MQLKHFLLFISLILPFKAMSFATEPYTSASSIAPKQALVAGGAGFLGSHLCDRLLEKGYYVICIDNFSSGDPKNIAHLLNHPRFLQIDADIAVQVPWDKPVDEIYNMACPASPPYYQKDPIQTWKTSVFGSFHLLELAVRWKAKIFQASTSEIYGDPFEHPQKESYQGNVNPIGIRACYDEGKRSAETLFFDFWRTYGVQIKVARIFNTYGPRMRPDDGRVISNLLVQAIRRNPLTIYGAGDQTRSFCYVSDLIDAIILFMETPAEITGPINLGNPTEFMINELAQQILAITKSSSSIDYLPLPKDDPRLRCPDISFAKKALGWQPKVPLETGLKMTLDYFQREIL
jgi:UDP-glucuronate decarboxylase